MVETEPLLGGTYPGAGVSLGPANLPPHRRSAPGGFLPPATRHGHSVARASLARQQRVEFAFALKLIKLAAAPDVGLADPNLRYGPAALGLKRHLGAQPGLAADIDLLEGDAFLLQQLLGHGAIWTKPRGVERNVRHRVPLSSRRDSSA